MYVIVDHIEIWRNIAGEIYIHTLRLQIIARRIYVVVVGLQSFCFITIYLHRVVHDILRAQHISGSHGSQHITPLNYMYQDGVGDDVLAVRYIYNTPSASPLPPSFLSSSPHPLASKTLEAGTAVMNILIPSLLTTGEIVVAGGRVWIAGHRSSQNHIRPVDAPISMRKRGLDGQFGVRYLS